MDAKLISWELKPANESIIVTKLSVGGLSVPILKSLPIKDFDCEAMLCFKLSLKECMETNAAIPNTMDAIKSVNFFQLAFPSRHAIFNSQPNPAFEIFVLFAIMPMWYFQ